MPINLNNINKGDGVGVEKTANNANSRINALAGFGQDYGQQEARLALALSDVGIGGGGGGGSSQNQIEFQDTILQDSTDALFISSREIDEETGAVTVTTRLLDGTAYTPTPPFTLPKNLEYTGYSVKYVSLANGTNINIGDTLVKYFVSPFSDPGFEQAGFWFNETLGRVSISPPTNVVELEMLTRSQKVLREVSTSNSLIQVKTGNALIKDIFVDNLGTGAFFVQIFQSQTGSPTAGAVPIESYRIFSNGSISIQTTRVYLGEVYVGFSSTAGTYTPSTNQKNYIISFE